MSNAFRLSVIANIILVVLLLTNMRQQEPGTCLCAPCVCEPCKACNTVATTSAGGECFIPDYLDDNAKELNDIALYYKNAHNAVMTTDKFTSTYDVHSYETFYGKYLGFFRSMEKFSKRPIKLMEIGIGWGGHAASFHTYRKFLKKDQLDYYCYEFLTGDEVKKNRYMSQDEKNYYFSHMKKGDQNNVADLDDAVARFGQMDMIVDDGSHVCEHQLTSFKHLFLKGVAPGGVYIIEDLQTSFHKNWACGLDVQKNWMTFVNLIQEYIALLHFHWWENPKYNPQKSSNAYGQESFHEFKHATALDQEILDWIQTIDCDREICAFRKRLTPMVHRKHGRM